MQRSNLHLALCTSPIAAVILGGFFVACSSTTTQLPAAGDAAVDTGVPAEETGTPEDAGADAAPPACGGGDASDTCAKCEIDNCCDERAACIADPACKTAREGLDACIASTPKGSTERHSCFMSFEGKGKKALALHQCGEGSCRGPSDCDIP